MVSSNDDVLLLSSTLSYVTITSITVEANCGNTASFTSLDLTPFSLLTQLTVGSNSFVNVREVKLLGLQRLTRVVVGFNSFRGGSGGGLHLNGCSSLKSVVIGDGSFAGFAVFGIAGVPLLEEVRIGNGCLKSVGELRFIGMSGLKRVIVGENSLSNAEGDFSLKSCASVTELVIGSGSMKWFKSVEIVGTPALETIRIGGDSFKNVDELRLVDLPKLKRVNVGEDSFTNTEGSFELKNCASMTELRVGNRSMSSFSSFEITTPSLKTITIGDGCLKKVGAFALSGLSGLESVVIGSDSFSQRSGHFTLTSPSVKALVVGDGSCSQYTDCSIHDVPSLETLSIGDNSFVASSLELKRLNGLKSVVIGRRGFENCERAVLESLPELTSIQLGWSALSFKDIDNATLVMKSV